LVSGVVVLIYAFIWLVKMGLIPNDGTSLPFPQYMGKEDGEMQAPNRSILHFKLGKALVGSCCLLYSGDD